MNKKGFAISIILYSLVFLLITIFYILLGIVKTRYSVMNNLRATLIEEFNDSSVLTDKILKLCYDSGIDYVKKYDKSNGTPIDTVDGSGEEDVCYYTSSGNSNLANKNGNVIFGDYCWQIVRTTSTGGVKLLYNGLKTSDDKCPNDQESRPSAIGISSEGTGIIYVATGSNKMTYGTGFQIINEGNSSYFLLKNIKSGSMPYTDEYVLNGKYVCVDSSNRVSNTDTCDAIYYVASVNDGDMIAEKYTINPDVYYSQIGTSSFNSTSDSISSVGYMYNSTYNYQFKDFSTVIDIIRRNKVTTSYYYGDKATWNSSTNKYDLTVDDGSGNNVAPTSTSPWTAIRGSAKGRYTCMSATNTSCETVYYIAANSSNNYMYSVPLSNDEDIDTKSVTWTYAPGYIENGDTYTLASPVTKTIYLKDWYSTYSQYQDIYLCSDYTSNTCSTLLYIYLTSNNEIAYNESSNKFVFGNSVTYDSTTFTYTINQNSDPSMYHKIWDWYKSYNNISKSHYTCFETNSNSCYEHIYYVYYTSSTTAYYIELRNGDLISDVLAQTLNINNSSSSNLNVNSSAIKNVIENWYEQNLVGLSSYIDNYAVFCNDRKVKNIGGWDPNGASTVLNFENNSLPSAGSASLKCPNITDRFSQMNFDTAKLQYPVGLLTGPEIGMMGSKYSESNQVYWLLSPSLYSFNASVRFVNPPDIPVSYNVHSAYGVRPVIVLKSDTQVSGKGTYDAPYVVSKINRPSIMVTAKDQELFAGSSITESADYIDVIGLEPGDYIFDITLTESTNARGEKIIIPSNIVIYDVNDVDVTSKYDVIYFNGKIKYVVIG